MRINGSIVFKIKKGGGINPETGYPVKAEFQWSKPVPCNYSVNTHILRRVIDGETYTSHSYTILISSRNDIPDGCEQLRLTDRRGKILGEFSFKTAPAYLESMGRIKLIV